MLAEHKLVTQELCFEELVMKVWHQKELSKITFSIKAAYAWDYETNTKSSVASRSADVYVSCLLHHDNKKTCDPFNLHHWEFYVLATKELNEYTGSFYSITLRSLRNLSPSVTYSDVNEEVKRKRRLAV